MFLTNFGNFLHCTDTEIFPANSSVGQLSDSLVVIIFFSFEKPMSWAALLPHSYIKGMGLTKWLILVLMSSHHHQEKGVTVLCQYCSKVEMHRQCNDWLSASQLSVPNNRLITDHCFLDISFNFLHSLINYCINEPWITQPNVQLLSL